MKFSQEMVIMNIQKITPFDRIEAASEYLTILHETVVENEHTIELDIAEVADQNIPRCQQVLTLISYNLEKLDGHLKTSAKILNNLARLRRLLLDERNASIPGQNKVHEMSGSETTIGNDTAARKSDFPAVA